MTALRRHSVGALATAGLLLYGSMSATALAQPYVTGKLGYANSDLSFGEPYNGVVDDGSIAYGAALGFEFGEYFAFEVGANGYGDFDGRAAPCPEGQSCPPLVRSTSSNDVWTYTAAFVPRLELRDVDLFAKAGYYRAGIDTDTGFGDGKFNENGVLIGAGARWNFERPWNVSIEVERFDDNLYQFTVGFGWQVQFAR